MNDLTMWQDAAREDLVTVHRIKPPASYDVPIEATDEGTLADVDLSQCSITWSAETDTRVSGTIARLGAWDKDVDWLEIRLSCPAYSYDKPLAILIPNRITETHGGVHGAGKSNVTTTINAESVLWALSKDDVTPCLVIDSGTTYSYAMGKIAGKWLSYETKTLATSTPIVYEEGTSRLDMLYDLAAKDLDRLDVSATGQVTLTEKETYTKTDPVWSVSALDSRSIVLADSDSVSVAFGDTPSHVTVKNDDTDSPLAATNEVPSGAASRAARGYVSTKTYTLSSSTIASSSDAAAAALLYVEEAEAVPITRTISTLYFPVKAGECITYTDVDGTTKTYRVKEKTLQLGTMTQDLKLEEVTS